MTRYLLDTNIISNTTKPEPSPHLARWLGDQVDGDLFIAASTIAEIQRGILIMPTGRKRDDLEAWFLGGQGPLTYFAGRILSFDENAALIWAQLMADGRTMGRQRDPMDMLIASVAVANECVIATHNEDDFWGLDIINPLRTEI
ncbi:MULTISPECIES: PIN domain-containing protein [unclassified Rhizobium]|uniref:PIN domain-containing protein n=1 Tax=unclassified Rhizobium TaxID=2613769 RepID=UPI00084C3A0E|nr:MULTISPECIES: PIN domain-containing protein [unclassified Rhizobium]OEC97332.1 twitching motility protein PilT [Rhizobium sp. YK2]QYA13961.1 PIN domain-containing protein [Rhizobium sp. AB2/73]UEQ80108.1 PIN domain-containing protein [Rhizobium sp. AB2/73]